MSQDDWYTNLSQSVEKVNIKCHDEIQHKNELCAIRNDGVADCDTLSYNDVCKLIDLIKKRFKNYIYIYCI